MSGGWNIDKDLEALEAAAAAQRAGPRTPGRWQFPLLCVSLGLLAAVSVLLAVTSPSVEQRDRRWEQRVIRALDRGRVHEAVADWDAWGRELPQSEAARRWPSQFFQIHANLLRSHRGGEEMQEKAESFFLKALLSEKDPARLYQIKRLHAELMRDYGQLEKAAEEFALIGLRREQAKALALAGRGEAALEVTGRILDDPGAETAELEDAVRVRLEVLDERGEWREVVALAERCDRIPAIRPARRAMAELAAAQACFEMALSSSPERRMPLLQRAQEFIGRPTVQEAYRGRFEPSFLRGEIDYSLGQYDKAVESFNKSLEPVRQGQEDAQHEGIVWMRIGDAWTKLSNWSKALESYKTGFRAGINAEGKARRWVERIDALANLNEMSAAWRRQTRWDESIMAKRLLAENAHGRDQERHWRELAQLYLARAEHAASLGRAHEAEEGRYQAAMTYQELLAEIPFAPEALTVLWHMGLLLKGVGDLPDAAEALAAFAERGRSDPRYGEVLYELGDAWRQMGRYSEAIDVLDQNIRFHKAEMTPSAHVERGYPRAMYLSRMQLGETLLARGEPGDLERAQAAFESNLQDDGIDPSSQVWRDSLFGTARTLSRRAAFEKPPANHDLWMKAAEAWDHFLRRYERYRGPVQEGGSRKEHEEGRALYREALREKGWVEAHLERWEGAVSCWEEYLRTGETLAEGPLAVLLAEAYFRLGKDRSAEEIYSRVALSEEGRFRTVAFYRLGDIYARQRQGERSREAYRQAAEQAMGVQETELDAVVSELGKWRSRPAEVQR